LERGYLSFEITDKHTEILRSGFETPGRYYEHTRLYDSRPVSELMYVPPEKHDFERPYAEMQIRCLTTLEEGTNTYDAKKLWDSLSRKYDVKPALSVPKPVSSGSKSTIVGLINIKGC
jgi:hypothetical protein